jgi:thymidylate synthase (FAD)
MLEQLFKHQKIEVLDQGWVELIDWIGSDQSIVDCARVSYSGEGTRQVRDDKGLIDYLMRHKHTSPFESCEIRFHIKAPLFVARQWLRHRTANVNEMSGRYSVIEDEFYIPDIDNIGVQDNLNKQGTVYEGLSLEDKEQFIRLLKAQNQAQYACYKQMLELGVSRETARIFLPLNIYTKFSWKMDAHNLMHFLKLRCDPHAQLEIRHYAEAILSVFKAWLPQTYQSFLNHVLDATTFSRDEMEELGKIISNHCSTPQCKVDDENISLKGSRLRELKTKLEKLNIR